MKVKPIYIYLGVFVVFVIALIYFSNKAKESVTSNTQINPEMPEDDMHGKMNPHNKDEMPSKSNVMKEAVERMNALKTEVDKKPNDTMKVREYADMLTFAHKMDEALVLYEKLLRIDPKRVDVLLQLTFIHFNKGDFVKAEDCTNKILQFDNNSLVAKYNLGAIYQAKGDSKRAKEIWQDLARRYPQTEVGKTAEQSLKQIEQQPK